MPVHLKRKNGEVTPYKNSEYIPAFYFFPKEAMTKLPKELQELPRNPWFIFRDWDAIKIVESDLFLSLRRLQSWFLRSLAIRLQHVEYDWYYGA